MTAWILIALVTLILWVFWRALNWVFDLIGYGVQEPME